MAFVSAETLKGSDVTEDNGWWPLIYFMTFVFILIIDKVGWWMTRSSPTSRTTTSETQSLELHELTEMSEMRHACIHREVQISSLSDTLQGVKEQAAEVQDSYVRKDIECTDLTEALREVQGERDHYFTAWREEERQSGTLIETIRKLQQQQAQGRDGQELVAAEVQVDTLNPELDERNYQCEVLFRRIGALERERVRLLEILERMHYREYVDTEPEDENSPRSSRS